MKNWEEGSGQLDIWRLLGRFLMNVSSRTWAMWEGNTHGIEDLEGVI